MSAPSETTQEGARLAALRATEILDTAQEACFDSLTEMAAKACGTSVALVSLVDERRQWFKSRYGFGAVETPREFSFCARAIQKPEETMVIEDASKDERFRDNPLVVGAPGIRFYAGVPLVMRDGHALGTLCVIDREPRSLDPMQKRALEALAEHARAQLELRRAFHELRVANDELRVRARDLRAANEALDAFASSASHDLRAPLRRISQLADDVLATETLGAESLAGLARIQEEARRLHALVSSLLELGRATSGRLDQVPVDLSKLAREAFTRLESREPARRAQLEIHGDLTTRGDPALLALAVSNLVENAWKFTREAAPALIVVRGERAHDGTLVASVEDNGVGFDPVEARGRLFAPFRRLRTAAHVPGTGVGLATVRRVIERHGGRIWAASEPGKGAAFHFTLPPSREPAPVRRVAES